MKLRRPRFAALPPGAPKYRLFVGLFPTAEAASQIADLQAGLKEQLGLRGKSRPREILHVTLHLIGDYPEMPGPVIDSAIGAGSLAFSGQPPVEITFDRVKSFSGRPGNLPFILLKRQSNEPLMNLHLRLMTALAKYKLPRRGSLTFVPHLTLLYDRQRVPIQPVPPVGWIANEVTLILSHLGETRYDHLHRWTLGQ